MSKTRLQTEVNSLIGNDPITIYTIYTAAKTTGRAQPLGRGPTACEAQAGGPTSGLLEVHVKATLLARLSLPPSLDVRAAIDMSRFPLPRRVEGLQRHR
jgi:hypothetical protein